MAVVRWIEWLLSASLLVVKTDADRYGRVTVANSVLLHYAEMAKATFMDFHGGF